MNLYEKSEDISYPFTRSLRFRPAFALEILSAGLWLRTWGFPRGPGCRQTTFILPFGAVAVLRISLVD